MESREREFATEHAVSVRVLEAGKPGSDLIREDSRIGELGRDFARAKYRFYCFSIAATTEGLASCFGTGELHGCGVVAMIVIPFFSGP